MGTIGSFYLNGPNLVTSTGIFTDSAFTTCAPNGWYSQEGNVRQLLNCVLLPRAQCPSCSTACGGVAMDSPNSLGLYLIPIELDSAIGAIKVSFSPGDIPDGIRGIYNNGVFNEFSSEADGYHATSVTDGLTYMGNSANVGTLITGSPHGSIIEYDFYNSIYTPNGNTTTVDVSAGSASLSITKSPDTCIAYIPKTLSSPTTLSMQIAEVLGGQPTPSWSLTVGCPATLSSKICTDVNPVGGCTTAAPLDNTIFLGKVSGVDTIPVIHDWAFADAYAETKKATGDYVLENKTAVRYLITVSANGVITAVTACP
jgi:hypothetical protein